jgi:hypothetical protein
MGAGRDDSREPGCDTQATAIVGDRDGGSGDLLASEVLRTNRVAGLVPRRTSGVNVPAVRLGQPQEVSEMHTSTGRRTGRTARLAVTVAAVALLAAACSTNNGGSGGGGSSNGGKKIALLLPESKTTRYEAQDRPLF